MFRRRTMLLPLVCAACAAVAPTPQQAQQILTTADAQIQAGAFDAALSTLDELDGKLCPKRLCDRRDVLRATAEFDRGEYFRSFQAIERFGELYPYSDLRGRVVDLLWDAGKAMLDRDSGFLFFWSDRNGARTVLRHLITHHPDTERYADASRILGDLAFADGDYETAQDRYRDIILNRPDSDWRFYAQFRFAMSIVAGLRGPDYDFDRMQDAATELRGFLDNASESPQMRAEAERALQQVLTWQVQRHLDVADYYHTLSSELGERYHLEQATAPVYASVDDYTEAVRRRQEFEAEHPQAATAETDDGGARRGGGDGGRP